MILGKRGFVFALLILLSPWILDAQTQSQDGVWKRVETQEAQTFEFQAETAASGLFAAFALNQERIDGILRKAPREFSEAAQAVTAIVSIPFPDGSFERFRVEASPVIEKPLESRGFETITYKGIGIDDPSATIRFEQAFDGFHAMVRSARGVFYIDPSTKAGNRNKQGSYVSYFASARPSPVRKLHCEVSSDRAKQNRRPQGDKLAGREAPPQTSFAAKELRTYRLALAVNSNYVAAIYDDSIPASPFDQAAAALTRTVNRINGIYESEFGVRFDFVPNEAKIIYADARVDPYRKVNSDPARALSLNQANLDTVIGTTNYDIGHLFTTQTAGMASVGSVCNAAYKAQGVTGIEKPRGDDFDVDYVSHEIGHQFGANHTFNAITRACKGNRYAETAYEPGSGSTIMGYAGICDPESLQEHTDPYFHLGSLLEIENFIGDTTSGGGGSCGTTAPLTFGPPSVSASGKYTVPKGTPILLTVAKSDSSNPTLFNWEEFDLGDAAPPDDDSGPPSTPRPLFRSRKPDGSGLRFFPDFEYLVQGTGTPMLGETLPILGRTMKFRVIGRNNHGSFKYAEIPVKIDVNSGPFRIISVSGGNSWSRGSVHKIQWDAAHTDGAPINCTRIDILLAVDENSPNLFLLASGIPNSGSYDLTLPTGAPLTERAFLILKAEKNIFLAVYPFSLQITAEH